MPFPNFIVFFLILSFQDKLTQPAVCREEAGKIKANITPETPEKAVENFLILICAGEKKKAEELLKNADDKFPNNFLIKFNLGNFYITEEKYDFAIFFLNQARRIKEVPSVFDSLATAYIKFGDIDSAEKIIEEGTSKFLISKLDEDEKKFLLNLILKRGIIRMFRGEVEKAESDFREYLKYEKLNPYPYLALAEIMGRKGKIESAKETLLMALANSDSGEINLYAGAFFHSNGYFEEATHYYLKAAEKLSKEKMYLSLFMLGTVQRDLGMYYESRESFEKAKKYPELATAKAYYSERKRLELVKRFIEKGNIKGAEFELRDILNIFPENKEAKKLLIDLLYLKALLFSPKEQKIKILEEARELAKSYLDKNPGDDEVLVKFALINLWLAEIGPKFARSGNILHAISALQNAVKIKDIKDYRTLLAISYYMIEKYDSAIEELKKLPPEPKILLFLASAYIKSGDIKKAEEVLKNIKDKKDENFLLISYEIFKNKKDNANMQNIEKLILGENE
ncbi:Beta-barrel assembly-enhancing protease [bacterium HR19]|nr:Beta-barrel assembly-enhancing protease [bacterium HR19]